MDSKAFLDYALFQLTPTRTRCDLVLFSGKKSEKVASGLVEPFIAHLKYAKDQIPKGGYSITLRPPAAPVKSSWFTKATFLRFVRFVSTPEILERITRIEREILQIDDSSNQSSDITHLEVTTHLGEESLSVADWNTKKTNSAKSTSEEEDHGGLVIENSRVRLRRVMDSRKAVLQKEQAMAYARAVVAGYEIDSIDDLICFADTFGALRLRETCIDFKELYKKKHSDDQWMDELAAVQAYPGVTDLSYMATSGIMLAGENVHGNGSDSTSTSTSSDHTKENNLPAASGQTPHVQQQVPWMNQLPPYMYNFQGPIQQIPPYYPYYPGHMGWSPPGAVVPSKNHKLSRKKEKSLDSKGTPTDSSEEEEDEDQTASSESEVEKEQPGNKKHSSNGKKRHSKKSNKTKGSKTVVIRNINYITSKRHDEEENGISGESSGEDVDSSIKEGVDNAIASFERRAHKNKGKQHRAEQDDKNELGSNVSEVGKGNSAWDAFQNLLLSHEESDSRDLPKHHIGDEHFVMKNSNGGISSKTSSNFDFSNSEDMHPGTRKIAFEGENALLTEQFKGSKTSSGVGATADFSAEEHATIRNRKEEDWFTVNNNSYGNSETRDANKLEFSNGLYKTGFGQKETTKGATVVDDSFIVESRSAVDEHYMSHWRTDINIDADIDVPKPKKGHQGISGSAESDDFSMMIVRESRESNASWAPEMDYEVEISFGEADKRSSIVETNGHAVKDPVANGKNVNGKKISGPTTKRIWRDVSRTLPGSLARSKLDPLTKSKKVLSPAMAHKSKLMKEEEDRKRMEEVKIQRQKRIAERTAASGLTSKACKNLPVGNKLILQKPEKNRSQSMAQKLSQAKLTA